MTRLRYYKDDAVKFCLYAIYSNDTLVKLDEYAPVTEFDTVKEAIIEFSNSTLHKDIKNLNKPGLQLIITMNVDNTKERTGDDTNILYYCKSAVFYFDAINLKLIDLHFSFNGIDGDFENAKYDNKDGVVTFGTGAMDAKEWFENECPNAKLADLLTKLYGAEWIKY